MHSPWGGSICHSWRAVPGEGEWGERIPDSPTLKAMRWVCATDPFDLRTSLLTDDKETRRE